tara:strand:+ start:397 stop:1122 length:726 start_codon:yes stop_codon:yes gene_type:complete
MSLELKVENLGVLSYPDAWENQRKLFDDRMKGAVGDRLLLVEHPPTISLGINKEWNALHKTPDEIKKQGVELVNSKRGGGAAYLGPGQLVGYPIMDIKPYGGVLNFMIGLEEVMIRTARDFGIKIGRHDTQNPTTNKPYRATWYLGNEKPATLCTKGIGLGMNGNKIITHHGFALNVNSVKPSYFHLIDPCGFPESEISQIAMSEIVGKDIPIEDVKNKVAHHFQDIFYGDSRKEVFPNYG